MTPPPLPFQPCLAVSSASKAESELNISTGERNGDGNDGASLATDGLLPNPDKAVPIEIEGPKRPVDPLADDPILASDKTPRTSAAVWQLDLVLSKPHALLGRMLPNLRRGVRVSHSAHIAL